MCRPLEEALLGQGTPQILGVRTVHVVVERGISAPLSIPYVQDWLHTGAPPPLQRPAFQPLHTTPFKITRKGHNHHSLLSVTTQI